MINLKNEEFYNAVCYAGYRRIINRYYFVSFDMLNQYPEKLYRVSKELYNEFAVRANDLIDAEGEEEFEWYRYDQVDPYTHEELERARAAFDDYKARVIAFEIIKYAHCIDENEERLLTDLILSSEEAAEEMDDIVRSVHNSDVIKSAIWSIYREYSNDDPSERDYRDAMLDSDDDEYFYK